MAQSVHHPCLLDAHRRIQALALDGTPPPNVYRFRRPTDRQHHVELPAVVVSYGGQEQQGAGDFEAEDFGYPVLVTILAAANGDLVLADDDEPVIVWRRQIRDEFLDRPAPGVALADASVVWVGVEFGPVIDEGSWGENVWASQLMLRYWVDEARDRTRG